jgi:hypothetical protein
MQKTLFVSLVLIGFVLVSTGCKDKEKEAAKVAAEKKRVEDSIKAATPPPPPPPMVASITMTKAVDKDKNATSPTSEFKSKERIIASIKSDNVVAGNMMVAKWLFVKSNQVVRVDSTRLQKSGSETTESSIESKKGLPPGDYKVEVSLDGKMEKSADFKVVK